MITDKVSFGSREFLDDEWDVVWRSFIISKVVVFVRRNHSSR